MKRMVALVAAAVLGMNSGPNHRPRWYDDMLAGYALAYDKAHSTVGVYDPKSRYMLVRTVDCDGADVMLLLTRDRNKIREFGYKIPDGTPAKEGQVQTMNVKPLPSLTTGKGPKIGDPPSRIEQVLGHGHKTSRTGPARQFLNYQYLLVAGKGDEATSYDETYTFKQGKLIEISFGWDQAGCAEEEEYPPSKVSN